ncbi:MAG: threonine--tRNA ligase, partial [Pseudomonadota bacterium]
WIESGHWDKFRENMFITEVDEEDHDLKRVMALKPMNCPCHVQIFKQNIRSYRDLPLRMSEFGSCHRYEPSGALHGLMRVRAFTQDDGHIFCTEDQIISESQTFCELLKLVYKDFGFEDISVKFSDRPDKRAGSDEVWDKAEKALEEATQASNLEYRLNPGEGAFYGPKLEFVLRDAIGRDWQCGTLQVDFVLPERLGAYYIDSQGQKRRPVMLHRAILGSFERFIGILIEHYVGRFPLWLAPVQIMIASISESSNEWVAHCLKKMLDARLRAKSDIRSEKINYKIREHTVNKIPIIAIVGEREANSAQLTLRYFGQKTQQTLTLEDTILQIQKQGSMPGKNR